MIALPRLLPVKTWPRRTREGGIRGPKAGLLLSRLEAPRASAMLLCEWSCLAAASRDAEDSVYNTKWVVHPWHEGLQHNEQVDQVCAERGLPDMYTGTEGGHKAQVILK